jgi:opacity protein-like surface antigen
MSSHSFAKLSLLLLFAATAFPVLAQVVPAATGGGGLTLAAGGGVSNYAMDFGPGREWGGTLWLDANLNTGPSFLQGLGIEIEARDLSLDRGPRLPNDMRTDTLGGGFKYSLRRYRNFRPYAKFLASYGSLDLNKNSYHFTWVDWAPGGGIEYRPFGRIWLRADYEYQDWPGVFRPGWDYDPQGFTFGAIYDFGHPHLHH